MRCADGDAVTRDRPAAATFRDDDPLAVLDARLRVRGVSGLVVADASAMPTITSGNTNAPTLMIAERAAQWLRAATSRPA